MKRPTIAALLLLLTVNSICEANVPMELNENGGVGVDDAQPYQSNVSSPPYTATEGSETRQIQNTRANDDNLSSILKMFWDGVVRKFSAMSTQQKVYLVAIFIGVVLLITIVYIGGQMGMRRTAVFYAGWVDYCLVVACWFVPIIQLINHHPEETHNSTQEIIGINCAIFAIPLIVSLISNRHSIWRVIFVFPAKLFYVPLPLMAGLLVLASTLATIGNVQHKKYKEAIITGIVSVGVVVYAKKYRDQLRILIANGKERTLIRQAYASKATYKQ